MCVWCGVARRRLAAEGAVGPSGCMGCCTSSADYRRARCAAWLLTKAKAGRVVTGRCVQACHGGQLCHYHCLREGQANLPVCTVSPT